MTEAYSRHLSGWRRRIAAVLLVVQATAGSAVALAHAAETSSGSVTLEAHHTAQCVVLHDTARCAQCQFDASRITSTPSRQTSWRSNTSRRFSTPLTVYAAPTRVFLGSAHPRAPPPLS